MSISKRVYVRTKPYPAKKVKIIEEACELLRKYPYVFVIDIHGVSNKVLQEYRFKLRRIGSVMKLIKNNLMKIAIQRVFGKLTDEVDKVLTGENILIFTTENPFEFIKWIEDNAVRRFAKPGDTVQTEIRIPAGNTGLSPGPILSKFGKLRIPTRVQDGKIWIVKDVVVAKPGDKVSPELAEILQKLKIKPIYESLKVKAVIFKGTRVIPVEELKIDISKYKSEIEDAVKQAVNLAFNIVYPIPEVLTSLIIKAHIEAINLAVNTCTITNETLPILLMKAIAEANKLASIIAPQVPELGIQITTPEVKPVEKVEEAKPEEKKVEEEKKEEEKKEEEEIASGLASLFG